MKTKLLLTAIFSAAIITATFANHVRTALNLRMFDGRPISVMVDGMPYGTMASQQEIQNLSPGIHRLKVFAAVHPIGWHGSMTPVFRGNVEVFEGFASYAVVQRWNSLVIEDYEALYVEPVAPPCQLPGNPDHSSYPDGPQFPDNKGGFQGSNCSYPGNNDHQENGGNNWGSYPGTGFKYPMNQNDFSQLLGVIESKSFESTKQQIALGAIGSNYFTSEQVRQMLNVFTFESTKVEVAKKAYDRVVDPDKYYLVYDAFTFESSISDLQASIR